LQSYQEALKRLPNSSLVFEEMGHVERRLGLVDTAEKHYRAASELDPRSIDILSTLADLYDSSQQFAQAEAVLNRMLEIAPGDETALTAKAILFQREGRLDASARELSKISPATDNEGAKLAGYLQLTYERRFDAIINRMEQDIASGQLIDPRCLVLLGDSQRRVGKTNDSRATLEGAVVVMKPAPHTAEPA